jgi:hypothetical protein
MQQDNNDMENKLRQLENQQLPDLSDMDTHWKQMQVMLKPHAPKVKPLIPKGRLWIVSAACLTGAILLIINQGGKKENSVVINENPIFKEKAKILADTIPAVLQGGVVKLTIQNIKNINLAKFKIDYDNYDAIGPNSKDAFLINALAANDSSKAGINLTFLEKQNMLKNLLIQIKKKEQIFTIDNSKDTVLQCKEGSVLVIPSYTFNARDSVVFEVKEFYKYADMVANGLTTMADEKQLVTGGMIYLSAKVKGKEVTIDPQKEIRVFIPNLCAKDSMQIFEGVKYTDGGDTIAENTGGKNNINWQLSRISIDSPVLKMFVRAIDLKDDKIDYSTTHNGKTKAVFHMATKSMYSKEELKIVLQIKYGAYYDKIRARKQWKRNLLFQKVNIEEEEYPGVSYNSYGVGDTAEFLPSTIKIYKLHPIDTVYNIVRWINKGYKEIRRPNFPATTLKNIGEKYSIGINKLGWINCDRFLNYPDKKADFIVDLKDSSYNYITYMVFENFKSIMQSGERGNYAVFSNVPVGEPVKIISVGVRDGKTMAAVKGTVTANSIFNDLQFELTSSDALKASLSKIEK